MLARHRHVKEVMNCAAVAEYGYRPAGENSIDPRRVKAQLPDNPTRPVGGREPHNRRGKVVPIVRFQERPLRIDFATCLWNRGAQKMVLANGQPRRIDPVHTNA